MPPPPRVPTWQIFPEPGGHFRWCPVDSNPVHSPQNPQETLDRGGDATRLPSMADLLLRAASSKALEGRGGCGGAMFRTGSGRSVSVMDSSIRKAEAVLEGKDDRSGGGDTPVFRTGSGKSVELRGSSIRRAEAILGGGVGAERGQDDDGGVPMFRTESGRSVSVRKSSIRKAASVIGEVNADGMLDDVRDREDCGVSKLDLGYRRSIGQSLIQELASDVGDGMSVERDGDDGAFPMFQTGLGKPVAINQISVQKAASVLSEGVGAEGGGKDGGMQMLQTGFMSPFKVGKISHTSVIRGERGQKGSEFPYNGDRDGGFPMFQTGSGKSVIVRQSSMRKAVSILDGDITNGGPGLGQTAGVGCTFADSLFQTGSGKTVNISPAGLFRANTSLGLEENCKISSTESSKHPFYQHGMYSTDNMENKCAKPGDKFALENQLKKEALANTLQLDVHASASLPPPIKFHTASGRSLLISHDAIQRARNLLGDSDLGVLDGNANTKNLFVSFPEEETTSADHIGIKENISLTCANNEIGMGKPLSNEGFRRSSSKSSLPKPSSEDHCTSQKEVEKSRVTLEGRSSGKPLAEISNTIDAFEKYSIGEKKRVRRNHSLSSFKKPRTSRFSTPLKNNIYCLPANGLSKSPISKDYSCKSRISTRYPFQFKRKTLMEFFGGPPRCNSLQLSEEVIQMTADKAEKYKFNSVCGSGKIEVESFQRMLLELGASSANVTKEWITNHYKWIVWKLACLERSYPTQASGKYLTVSNVIEELKYRYEREVNYGHRSAVKKILDGDASPASMVVLCISAIIMDDKATTVESMKKLNNYDETQINIAKVELTDGWYSLNAILDVGLSKHLHSGKLFVGQKLRIWGAGLCGWVGPVSPFEASKTINLLININGTYRAHWPDKLGFCKNPGAPLSFNCIKDGGGPVPRTLVGVSRIYPILYKERFHGGSIVRSERLESKRIQLYHQRRASIAEGIMSEQKDCSLNDSDSEEGAKIFKILQTSAEPEVLMADMSAEQLTSFSAYQAKQAAIRQSELEKKVEKAVKDAGLGAREVTPFIRVRVVGLTGKGHSRKCRSREGLITIWNPTEKLKFDLVEGQIYTVSGLVPLTAGSDLIYLQATGSSTIWKHIPSKEMFQHFFSPRKSVSLSNLGEFPLASEFDIAVVVLHVGEVYVCGRQKKQWIFVSDGSLADPGSEHERSHDCLLAISFCITYIENDPFALLSQALSGSTVCFYNLIKRPCDQTNHIWVAEARENSTYVFSHSLSAGSHLKEAADAAKKWAKISSSTIQKLKERILSIIGNCGS